MIILTWIKRIILAVCGLLVLLAIIGFVYEQISRESAKEKYSPQGELIEVNGHKLHFVKKGLSGPSVIFESGFDTGGHLSWVRVQNELSSRATTLSYDRAGTLWSERGIEPKTNKAIATELYTLLNKPGIEKPYILVGHSAGGLILREFIKKYPEDVSGVVFVDAAHPEQAKLLPNEVTALLKPKPIWPFELLNSLGVIRAFSPGYPNIDESDEINVTAKELRFKSVVAGLEEMNEFAVMLKDAGQVTSFGDIPLIVITGNSPNKYDIWPSESLRKKLFKTWAQLQSDLLNLSTDSQQVLAEKSGHFVQLDQPELVIEAIDRIILKAKSPKEITKR